MDQLRPNYYDKIALIAVDVQKDFCPGGSLAVAEGDLVVPALNKVIEAMKKNPPYHTSHGYFEGYIDQRIIATRDWHPAETAHFSETPDYENDWPVHCVADTEGAAFHPDLKLAENFDITQIVSKGTKKDEAGYSGFDGTNELGVPLEKILGNYRRTALLVGGLATDYCVRATVLDARERGYDTFVIEDAVRGVAPETTREAIEEMKTAGAQFMTCDEIVSAFEKRRR